jgi:uncharacterized ferredoxin-like protein
MEIKPGDKELIQNPEYNAVILIASMMCISARTAPKGKGVDTILTRILCKDELLQLADRMQYLGELKENPIFLRDAKNIRESHACVLVGCKGFVDTGLNCGGCGFSTCAEMRERYTKNPEKIAFTGPNCIIKITDLGIAVGSAVKTAQIHNVDNRILYTAGVGALSLNLLPECTTAYGIPLSVTGKNIFFDRRF